MRADPAKQRAWQQRGARNWQANRRRTPAEAEHYREEQQAAVNRVSGRCCAADMHHPDCPRTATVTHHIHERQHGGSDDRENLLPVWGGITGADGCHGILHANRAKSIELGYIVKPRHR